jgi:two-component system, cell cycle sensor histidine kinase and response regulator CckA
MNLVINARDAVGESGVIGIKTENLVIREIAMIGGFQIKPGSYIELSVADTGCGMDDDMIRRIFEPFFTTKEPGKGTGLGLAVVHGIVKNHSGYIFCESKPHRGTTFHIIFPATSGVMPEAIPEQVQKNIYGTEKILLVDDEKSILETVRDTLQLYGYQVVTAESGEEAVDIYSEGKREFDLVILDLIMPGGGKKCIQDLLQINPQVKVLISSGYAGSFQTHDLALAGAAGFINKPYQPEDLFLSIRKILDARTCSGNKPESLT